MRKKKYQTRKALQDAINEYFKTNDIHIVSGLANHLRMTTQALRDYGRDENFSDIVSEAKQRVEMFAEKNLYGKYSKGAYFTLRCHFKWRDNDEQSSATNDMAKALLELANKLPD